MQRLPTLDLFGALVFQVIGQQISVAAATAIFARLVERFGGRAPDPDGLVDLEPQVLRELGLSRQKSNTVLDLAVRHAVQASYGLDHLSDPDEVAALARRWSPYGSLASSLLLATARSK
jgi:3-methyladenine DNA glycosylase/8-oxoguanine DNA glycosylase